MPYQGTFEDDFPFPQVGICWFPRGYMNSHLVFSWLKGCFFQPLQSDDLQRKKGWINLILLKSFYLCNDIPSWYPKQAFFHVCFSWMMNQTFTCTKKVFLGNHHFQPTISSKGPLYTWYISNRIICDQKPCPGFPLPST